MKFNYIQLAFVLLLFSTTLKAEVLFEGYYKVTQFKKHIGFLILKHEVDLKTQNFKTTSFMRLGKEKFDITESYQAVSDSEMNPVSLNYLAVESRKTKTIQAEFKGGKMTGLVVEDGKKIKLNEKVPQGVFLSSALYYMMLKSKDGLKTGAKFDYAALTEEGPVVMKGTVSVDKKMQTVGKHQLLKIDNEFAGSNYSNLVSNQGEIYSAVTPATSIESELVKDKKTATEGVQIKSGTVEKVFGKIPEGNVNLLYSKGQ